MLRECGVCRNGNTICSDKCATFRDLQKLREKMNNPKIENTIEKLRKNELRNKNP
ncbi:MAG: hypothetical protein LBH07_03810 [Treponema sp.]|jgi:hypothetical protein|nr:hypothetical protein [Treponema sp.]